MWRRYFSLMIQVRYVQLVTVEILWPYINFYIKLFLQEGKYDNVFYLAQFLNDILSTMKDINTSRPCTFMHDQIWSFCLHKWIHQIDIPRLGGNTIQFFSKKHCESQNDISGLYMFIYVHLLESHLHELFDQYDFKIFYIQFWNIQSPYGVYDIRILS